MCKVFIGLLTGVVVFNAVQLMAFYNPRMGRWQTPDPIEEKGGLNLYAFCHNNALDKVDVDGCGRWNFKITSL